MGEVISFAELLAEKEKEREPAETEESGEISLRQQIEINRKHKEKKHEERIQHNRSVLRSYQLHKPKR